MYILGIETTCDETAISIVKVHNNFYNNLKFEIISNIILSQDIHNIFGGVYPEQAFRKHQENIMKIFFKAVENFDINKIDLIGVSAFPGLVGALAIGVAMAKTLGIFLSKLVIPVNHLWGHLFANFENIELGQEKYLQEKKLLPALGLVVSGGHTNLYFIENFLPVKIKLISRTLDDAVGEAYDKVARLLNLGFPGGPVIDKLANSYKPNLNEKPIFPIPKANNFSYSGLKTAVSRYIKNINFENLDYNKKEIETKKIAYYFQYSAIEHIIRKIELAILGYKELKSIFVGGGVAANSYLRKRLTEISNKYKLNLYMPSIALCTDNAAMIAISTFFIYKSFFENNNKKEDIIDFDVYPSEEEGIKIFYGNKNF
ncbi:MAG: tRNA (adenosine(37)-N6)-threonylcarbamoyltransferase complex transferase subunit TsaD [bacterium]